MTNLVISVSDDTWPKLQKLAAAYRIAPEELISVSIHDLLEQPENEFQRIVQYILAKNAELYRRLA
ncbi:MAG: hypothetical protein KDE19_00905 [Caldilineaceae bacterium]|nr:hypothetical protein [Caldilineaceae bacterium]